MIFAFLIISAGAYGQKESLQQFNAMETPILRLWDGYLQDCNKLIPDTTEQSGIVNFEYKPVIFKGKVSHFNAVPIDTIWDKIRCNKYKSDVGLIYPGLGVSISSISNNWTDVAQESYSEPKQEKTVIKITHDKICMIKKQKASWEDFWDRWCKEQNLIKFN